MPRPKKCRRICHRAEFLVFKPIGVPYKHLEVVTLNCDELEAVRLADLNNKKQEDAASEMRISRQTFGRILNSAHHKIADALINNKSIEFNRENYTEKDFYKSENEICFNKKGSSYGKI